MGDAAQPGDLAVRWIHGSTSRRRPADPPLQVHRYRDDTIIARQSKDVTFEAPFVFLLFGAERALLLDTGAVDDDTLRRAVDDLVAEWVAQHPHPQYELVVAHTHGHGDHVAGDPSFSGRPHTVTVGRSVQDVRAFFGFTAWPDQVVEYDLGGRCVELLAIPGHHPASLAVHDERTGLLFTGDSVYPGRLYVEDVHAFVESLDRLVDFAQAREVRHVLGCHIEMTRQPGRDYYLGCRHQADEPPLQMTLAQLRSVRDAAASVAARPGIHRFDAFVICNGTGPRTQLPLVARALAGRARDAVRRAR